MFVLITIPHSFCATKIVRTCDLRAVASSKILINVLNKKKIKHAKVQMHISRLDVDVNRMKPQRQIYNTPTNTSTNTPPNTLTNTHPNTHPNTPPDTTLNKNKSNNKKTQKHKSTKNKSTKHKSKNKSNETEISIKYWNAFNNRIINIIKNHTKILLLDIHSFPKGSFDGAQIAIIDIQNINRPELEMFANYIIKKTNIDVKIFNGADNNIQNTYNYLQHKSTYPLLLEFCEDRSYLLDEGIKLFFEEVINFFRL